MSLDDDPRIAHARTQVGQLMSLWGNMGFDHVSRMVLAEEEQKLVPLVQEAITEGLAFTIAAEAEAGKLRKSAEATIAEIEAQIDTNPDCVVVVLDSLP